MLMGRVGRRGVAIITVCDLSKDCWDVFTFLGHVKGHICCLPKKTLLEAHSWLEIPTFFFLRKRVSRSHGFLITSNYHNLP